MPGRTVGVCCQHYTGRHMIGHGDRDTVWLYLQRHPLSVLTVIELESASTREEHGLLC